MLIGYSFILRDAQEDMKERNDMEEARDETKVINGTKEAKFKAK